jgi:hypothetical protein
MIAREEIGQEGGPQSEVPKPEIVDGFVDLEERIQQVGHSPLFVKQCLRNFFLQDQVLVQIWL